MTDVTDETKPQDRQTSFAQQPTILEEPSSISTISALVNSTPLLDPTTANVSANNIIPRTRRRSSVSILQALVGTSHLLATNDARKR